MSKPWSIAADTVNPTIERYQDCPDAASRHTGKPADFDPHRWHLGAWRASLTHFQERCPTCGYWVVWVPK